VIDTGDAKKAPSIFLGVPPDTRSGEWVGELVDLPDTRSGEWVGELVDLPDTRSGEWVGVP
jgi:hypothetical protein